jgi:hypothetical protein
MGTPPSVGQDFTPRRFFQCHRPVTTSSAINASTAVLGTGTDESWMSPKTPHHHVIAATDDS